MKNNKILLNITLTVIFIFSAAVCFSQTFNSPETLKSYLDKQPANSQTKPIKVTMNVNEQMLNKIATTIKSVGKYVNLDLSGSKITYIGWGAFNECAYLTYVTIPDSVIKIDDVAFVNCTSLTSIIIPNNVASIGFGAFSGCTSLTALSVNSDNTTYISDDGVLYNKSKTTLVAYPGGKIGTFTIPNNVTSIGEGAFSGSPNLTSVTIPDSVTSIGHGAFSNCSNLTSVTIPDSVTSIGDWTFLGCTSLTNINIPNSVTSIGHEAFSDCTSLISITIPNSVKSISNFAFSDCLRLTRVTFQGTISSHSIIGDPFPGDLRYNYLTGGIGTYTRETFSNTWKKQ